MIYVTRHMWQANLAYATLVTYVAVLGDDQFQLLCKLIFDRFLAEEEQKPKLVSAQPQDSQTLNQKIKFFSCHQDLFIENLQYIWCVNGHRAEGHTEAVISVEWKFKNLNIQILMS